MLSKISQMLSSIKWKFVVVYFLLVFIAMVIVGVFIVTKLEGQQIKNVNDNMRKHIQNINTSSYLSEDNWEDYQEEIQNTIDDWNLDNKEVLYVITKANKTAVPRILCTSLKDKSKAIDQNALAHSHLVPTLINKAYEGGKEVVDTYESPNEIRLLSHMAYPVYTDVGRVKGILYMTSDLKDVLTTIAESKIILLKATLIALIVTISLGFLIANSITEPIRDVTKKAEEMANGDFDQKVEIKSNDEIGQLASMFNHLTTKLKETIEEIDFERSKLDTIFNYMTEGVLAIDKDGFIIHANPIAEEILDLTDSKFQDKVSSPVKFPRERLNLKIMDTDFEDLTEGDELADIRGQIYKVKYACFKNEGQDLGGIILVFQNITNEHKLDNMRKEFVANVSHELKTPITTIKSYTETLMDGDMPKDIQMDFLRIIDEESNRMNRLVKDLLQLSNLDFKKTVWNREEVDINDFLKKAVKKLEFSFKDKNQNYILSLKDGLASLNLDRDAIEQVILNIISNAIKYTGEGGEIEISTFDSDNFITISIRDNGYGIPEEDLGRIFERFYRVEKGRSRERGGTGLGLAIAKEIVEAHNGLISIDSVFGEGSLVEIKFPLI